MKPVHEEFRYDHPVAEVFSLVASGAFQVELTEWLGGKRVELLEESADGLKLVTSQQTAIELPGFAKKLIPANTTVVQTYTWLPDDGSGNRRGTWAAATKGAPLTIGGPIELIADGASTVQRYLGEIKASVPLVGGKLESFAYDNLRRDLGRAHEYTAGRLKG